MPADVTVVIPWRDTGDEHRRRNLEALKAWLAPLKWPIILADSKGKQFNRSAARNAGVKQATTRLVVIHDADIRVEHNALRETARLTMRLGGLRHPYRVCRYLDEDNTQLLLRGRTPRAIVRASRNAPGGCSIIRRQDYLDLRGYDEDYTGWGYEDLDFAKRAKDAIGQTWGRTYGYHLWHPEAERGKLTEANRLRFHAVGNPDAPPMREGLMDVVYRVRPGDNNEELRYSLRSLANFPHRTVWIVGHLPKWVTGVEHIKGNLHPGKWPNVYDNLRIACRDERISDPFVLLDDDMFLMHELDEVPNYYRGSLTEQADTTRQSSWDESIRSTLAYLRAKGYADPTSYELHIPYVVHKAELLQALDDAAEWSWPNPPQWRTLDGNVNQRGGIKAPDVKIRKDIPEDSWALSTTDATFARLRPMLAERFPTPCQYEA